MIRRMHHYMSQHIDDRARPRFALAVFVRNRLVYIPCRHQIKEFVPLPTQFVGFGFALRQIGLWPDGHALRHLSKALQPYPFRRQNVRHQVQGEGILDRKSTRLNSSHLGISYAVFCLKKKIAAINRAKSRVTITEIIEKQNRTLFESKAGALRDFQTATADLAQARADLRTAESSLEAARNRLAILGKTDAEITAFQDQGKISSETPIYAPLSGTVVQRKIGPGQYVSYTGTGIIDPVFTIGDLSTVWLVAYVRESEAPKVRSGQQIDFTVLAYPKTTFKANIDHVAASLDPSIRRLLVRATIDNSNGQFKPEMFTSVTIYTDEGDSSIAVPRDAVIYEADNARVWVARADKTIEVRQIKTGITRGGQIQVLQGLQPGEIVVTKGSLFVDQAAGS